MTTQNIDHLLGKIHNCDCLPFMRSLPDKCCDLILTDPPYGIGRLWVGGSGTGWGKAKQESQIRNEWDNKTPSQEVFDEIFRISKNQVIWGGNYFNLPTSRGWLVWNKPERGFSLAEGELAWTSFDSVIRVFDCHRSDTGREHPTQKPEELMRWCVVKKSDAAAIIFDPFMGSGTTAVACERLGRKWFGCELEPQYCEIANKRIEAEKNQLKLF